MKASNQKQVAVLSVVAVGAIAFLGSTLFSLGDRGGPAAASPPEGTRDLSPARAPASDLLGDPFSHPQLAVMSDGPSVPPKSEVEASPPSGLPAADTMPAPSGGLEPAKLPGVIPMSPRIEVVPDDSPQPAEIAGNDRKDSEAQTPLIALTAIVTVERPVAFMKLNNGESSAFRPGDALAPGIRLLQIEPDFVSFRTPKGTFRLSVGQEIRP